MSVETILDERSKTHGSFEMNAQLSQGIKGVFHYGYMPVKVAHREALDMIALKLSRILSGQADFRDHWDDIAGYAKLASQACAEPAKTS